ncbi:MAG TPA: hypothetical protein VF181_00850 [Balneolaceae bacterium]
MITLRINNSSQTNSNIEEQWIREQIQNRRAEGQAICVEFEVHYKDVNMIFPFGNCPSRSNGGGGGQNFSKRTWELIDFWKRIKDREINPGLIISFWKHILNACN